MNVTKKILSVLMVIVLLFTVAPVSGLEMKAEAESEGDFTYEITEDNTATITGYTGDGGDVVIPDSLGGYSVTEIGWYAFFDCTSLTSITIPDSVTGISSYAFHGCTSLTSITIPDSVTSIGSYAFSSCVGLANITVGENNECYSSDEYGVLFNKDKTELIRYPGGNTRATYTIPDSVTSIIEDSFSDCISLTSITISDSVTSIGGHTFYNCTSLTSITIPDSVTSIGYYAFDGCTSLTSVTIGNGVTSIGWCAFSRCTSLTAVYITDIAAWCKISFSNGSSNPFCDGGNLYLNGELVTDLVIPDGITSIGNYAFYYCTSLTSITIPDSVTSIGISAFYMCESLENISIGNDVTAIGDYAFYYCTSLTSITVDENNEYYSNDEYGVLFNKDKTELIQYPVGNTRASYTIADSVTSIADNSFCGCTSLASITIPDGVISIGENAFSWYTSITNITVDENNEYYSSDECGVLFNKDKTELIQYPSGNTRASYTIPDSVTSIGSYAFSSCVGLANITVGENNECYSSDEYGVLFNKDKTELIRYPGGNTRATYTIPDSVTSIIEDSFSDCISLTSITIGNGVTSIAWWSFYACESLTNAHYCGTQKEWDKVDVGESNECLTDIIHMATDEDGDGICDLCPVIEEEPTTEAPSDETTTATTPSTEPPTTKPTTTTPVATKPTTTAPVTVPTTTPTTTEKDKTETVKAKKPTKVTAKKVKSTKKKQAVVTWATVKTADGYQVAYSTTKKFTKKTTKSKLIKKAKTTKTTLKKLKSGKKYFIKVRAYKTVKGKKLYGAYSKIKTVKVK